MSLVFPPPEGPMLSDSGDAYTDRVGIYASGAIDCDTVEDERDACTFSLGPFSLSLASALPAVSRFRFGRWRA